MFKTKYNFVIILKTKKNKFPRIGKTINFNKNVPELIKIKYSCKIVQNQ